MESRSSRPLGKVRSIALVFTLSLLTIGFYAVYWWYKVNDEVRKHDPEIEVRPWLSAIAFSIFGTIFLFIPTIVTVYRTARRICEMQRHCRVKRILDPDRVVWLYITSWLSIPLLFFFAPLCFILYFFFVADIQDNLNDHWKWHRRMQAVERSKTGQEKAA